MSAPELRLKRFLNYGKETPLYLPGNRLIDPNYFSNEKRSLTAIDELVSIGKYTDAAAHIVKAFSDGYSGHPECLVFALACCAKQKTSEQLREAAYNAVKTVCKSPPNFFLFIKFLRDLRDPANGGKSWGHGMRRIVLDWYMRQTAEELAETVSRFKTRFGWSHKDIIKLGHVSSKDQAKAAVFLYVMKGLTEAKNQFANVPEAAQVLEYLHHVEEFKKTKDAHVAARLLEQHNFSIEHVPSHFQRSQEIWNALVPRLPLEILLKNLNRLGKARFLKPNSILSNTVEDALKNQTSLAESGLHPSQIFITLRNYENSGKIKGVTTLTGAVKAPPAPNPKITESLYTLLDSSYKLLVPTGQRYLIAVNTHMGQIQYPGQCSRCPNVNSLQISALFALCLVKAERDVTVLAFTENETLVPVEITKENTLREAEIKLKKIENPPENANATLPIKWAKQANKPVDVFIMMTFVHQIENNSEPAKALVEYRSCLQQPNAKFALMAFGSSFVNVADAKDPGMLDLCGLDDRISRVLEAFCRGAF